MIALGIIHMLIVLAGAVVCASYVKQHWGVWVAGTGFALSALQLACVWILLHDGGVPALSWGVVFAGWLFRPWPGAIAILFICVGTAALVGRWPVRDSYRWAIVAGAGVALHCALLVGATIASRDLWYVNPYGKPFGLLAVILPSGHVVGQLAILVGVLGVLRAGRRTTG